MIFVTVGTQLPFPRLLDMMARIEPDLGEPIVAQTCQEEPAPTWQGMELHTNMAPAQFERAFDAARVVVAHAGIGSILTARSFAKPLIVMPRRHDLGEHRNDHQLATVAQVSEMTGVYVARDEDHLRSLLEQSDLQPAREQTSPNREALIAFLKGQLHRSGAAR